MFTQDFPLQINLRLWRQGTPKPDYFRMRTYPPGHFKWPVEPMDGDEIFILGLMAKVSGPRQIVDNVLIISVDLEVQPRFDSQSEEEKEQEFNVVVRQAADQDYK